MRIGIFGAGSVGCYVGGMVAAAGGAPCLVGRAAMGRDLAGGMTLTRHDGTERFASPAAFEFSQDAALLAGCRAVLVCVKSADTVSAGRSLAPVLGPDTVVVSLQNGVGNAQRLRTAVPRNPVLAGMVAFNVARIGASRFHCATGGGIVLAAGTGATPVAAELERAGIETAISADIEAVQWGKLLMNLNNAVNALAGIPLQLQLSQRPYRRVLAAAIREALACCRAAGIRPARIGSASPGLMAPILELPDPLFRIVARGMLRMDREARSSMADDLDNGRTASEVDWLNGEIVRLGRRFGVPTPVNERLVERVTAAFADGRSPRLTGPEMEAAILPDRR